MLKLISLTGDGHFALTDRSRIFFAGNFLRRVSAGRVAGQANKAARRPWTEALRRAHDGPAQQHLGA